MTTVVKLKIKLKARPVSASEELFVLHLKACRLAVVREHQFHDSRKWRFDFAFLDEKLAVEIEGGAWSNGRHTRGAGFVGDMEKYNAAVVLGWKILRFTPEAVKSGRAIEIVKMVLSSEGAT